MKSSAAFIATVRLLGIILRFELASGDVPAGSFLLVIHLGAIAILFPVVAIKLTMRRRVKRDTQ